MAPDSNPREEVTLSKFKKLFWSDITNTPLVNHTISNVARLN
jgi:hypothetical protein